MSPAQRKYIKKEILVVRLCVASTGCAAITVDNYGTGMAGRAKPFSDSSSRQPAKQVVFEPHTQATMQRVIALTLIGSGMAGRANHFRTPHHDTRQRSHALSSVQYDTILAFLDVVL